MRAALHASALGTASIAFAVIYTGSPTASPAQSVELLAHAGQMSLTLYVAHALVFNLVVNWLGWVSPPGSTSPSRSPPAYWIVAITVGSLWHRRFGIGPVEWVYRKLGG